MKKQKLFTILGITAIIANLTIASVAQGQTTTGQVSVGCDETATAAANVVIQPPGGGLFDNVDFGTVTYGNYAENQGIVGNFTIQVSDQRGYNPADDTDPGTIDDTCGEGFFVYVTPNAEYFTSGSGNNPDTLSIQNDDTPDARDELSILNTSWAEDDTSGTGARISNAAGVEDASSGVYDANIDGGDELAQLTDFTWDSLGSQYNDIIIMQATEAYDGEVNVLFESTDINLDIPDTTPVDTYTLNLTISQQII